MPSADADADADADTDADADADTDTDTDADADADDDAEAEAEADAERRSRAPFPTSTDFRQRIPMTSSVISPRTRRTPTRMEYSAAGRPIGVRARPGIRPSNLLTEPGISHWLCQWYP